MPIFPLRRTTATATARRRRPARPALGLEALEGRALLAIMVDVVDNTNLGSQGAVYITGHGIPGAPGAAATDLRVLAPTGAFVQGAVQIDTATCSSSPDPTTKDYKVTITTLAPHQLKTGDKVCVDGVHVSGYNGVFTVTVPAGPNPTSFTYPMSSPLATPSSGGAAYLPALLSTQTIQSATIDAGGNVTVTLSGAANLPKATPICIAGLSGGSGIAWNGMFSVSQNSQSDPALKSTQFQYTTTNTSAATATATVTANSTVTIVALTPVAVASLPKNNKMPSVKLDDIIKTYSSQLVPIVTPAGQSPFPLGITPGTINIANLNPAPFSVGEQTGNSVFDIVEFYFGGNTGNSTFDLSQVDGFALPLTLATAPSSVTQGPYQVGLNTSLPNLSREQIGNAFTAFINKESTAVKTNAQFGRLLYDSGVSSSPLTVAPASQTGPALTGVALQPGKDPTSGRTFTGSISGTTLTVTNGATNLAQNKIIEGPGVLANTYVTQVLSQSGETGTYVVNQSQTVVSTTMTGYNSTGLITATKASNVLLPGQSITLSGTGSSVYDGQTFTVKLTPLNDTSLSPGQFVFQVATSSAPVAATATVTPTNAGVIATGTGNLVVTVTSGSLPTAGTTVQLSGVPNGTFSASVNVPYTVQNAPAGVSLPANAVYLATTTNQVFTIGSQTGGGTLSTPILAAPPAVPGTQFFVIAAPKDWLADQPVSAANVDPMVSWWDDTIDKFFSAEHYLQVAVGDRSYTGVSNGSGYDFYSNLATSGTSAFTISKPTPTGGQHQSLANATWVWGQAVPKAIAKSDQALVQDQIWGAMCRGVVLDGVLKTKPTSTGQSNALWTADPSKWYTEHASISFPDFTSVYCPFSKFLHYATLNGGTDRTGTSSIYLGNLAYGFSEDETPYGANGSAIATATPSKMDQTVLDGATMTLTVNPWIGGTPQAPYVTSIDTIPAQSPPGTPTPTTATTLSWTVSFSEPVQGVKPGDFAPDIVSDSLGLDITGVTASTGTALSQTWTVTGTVTGTGTGVIGVNLTQAGTIKDKSGSPLTLPGGKFTGQTYSVTTNPVGPTAAIAIAGTNPTNAATVPFTVTFSQPVTGLKTADFTTVATGGVTGTSIQSVSGSGTTYTVVVNTGSGSGTLALKLASGTGITPAPSNVGVTSPAYTIDKNDPTKAPEVQGIALAGTSPTSAASVSWTVTFTEPVTGVTAANFALVNGGLGGTPVITGVSPVSTSNTATWTVTASTGSGSGTLNLKMLNSTGVRDADSQAVTTPMPFSTPASVYTVDRTAPAAQTIQRATANPTSLSVVSWTVTFSEAVAGLSKENFQLAATGLKGAQVMNVAPASDSAPSAVWTVTAATGSGVGTLRLDLENARGITDAVGLAPTGIPLKGQTYTVSRGGATNVDAPIAFMTTMGGTTPLRWLMNPFTDADSAQLTATLSVAPGVAFGTLRAASGGGVTVAPTGTAASELRFTGTTTALNAYFRNAAGLITYTPAGSSLAPRSLTLSAQGSDGLSGFATAALLVRAASRQSPALALNAAALLAGTAGQPLVITYAQLVAATGATQTASRSVQFMLAAPPSGRLEVWSGGRWNAVPSFANTPLLAPGGRIRWTPPTGVSGTRPAFAVKTWDGWQMSRVSQVSVNLAR